jgi:hypothetical protein
MKLSFLIASAMLLSSTAVWAQPQAGSDMPPPPPPHGGMLQETDADGDGKVSRAEFLSKAEDRFNKADANGDGFITRFGLLRRIFDALNDFIDLLPFGIAVGSTKRRGNGQDKSRDPDAEKAMSVHEETA